MQGNSQASGRCPRFLWLSQPHIHPVTSSDRNDSTTLPQPHCLNLDSILDWITSLWYSYNIRLKKSPFLVDLSQTFTKGCHQQPLGLCHQGQLSKLAVCLYVLLPKVLLWFSNGFKKTPKLKLLSPIIQIPWPAHSSLAIFYMGPLFHFYTTLSFPLICHVPSFLSAFMMLFLPLGVSFPFVLPVKPLFIHRDTG